MKDCQLRIIDNDLYIITNEQVVIHIHKAVTKIIEFREIKDNCIIVREDTNNYKTEKSNIYCLNNNLEFLWYSEQPFDADIFPNHIVWNKEIDDNGVSWDDYVIDNIETFTCSSMKGFTVSVNYNTGKITKSIFTK